MSCILTQDFDLDCADSLGGISEFCVLEHSSLDELTEVSGVITAITTVSSKKFQRYKLRDEVGSLQFPGTHNQQNGTTYYEHTLAWAGDQLTTSKRNEFLILAKVNVVIIAKDENGRYWLAGRTKGMYPSALGGGTGTAKSDRNGLDMTLIAREKEPPIEVDSDLITSSLINGL